MVNHKGMQGDKYIEDEKEIASLSKDWLYARDRAVAAASDLYEKGLTKQLCNRLLEPFMWHTVIATATEWENFFALRAHPAAEIHIQALAFEMLKVYNDSHPKELKMGDWHIPFGDKFDFERISKLGENEPGGNQEIMVKIATARCARISYNNFEGSDDYQKDIALHDNLSTSGHWSPFEHCAKALTSFHCENKPKIMGNFTGFKQYRKMFENENQRDSRVDLKVREFHD
jgi:hypothetical protein